MKQTHCCGARAGRACA